MPFLWLISLSNTGGFSFHSGGNNRIFGSPCWPASRSKSLAFLFSFFCVCIIDIEEINPEFLTILVQHLGLGLLCTIFDWEHFSNSLGSGKHFSRVRVIVIQNSWIFSRHWYYDRSVSFLLSWRVRNTKLMYASAIYCRLLQAAISGFSSFFPDYQDRIARHEAAHFLSTLLLIT